MVRIATAAVLFVMLAGCGDSSSSSTAGGRCLTDADVCQFTIGVSTKQQVKAALGNPYASQSINDGMGGTIDQWIYVCQPDPQSAEQVQFIFDANGVLMDRLAISAGPGAPPAPTCP